MKLKIPDINYLNIKNWTACETEKFCVRLRQNLQDIFYGNQSIVDQYD